MKERPPIWRVAANILNKQAGTADKGWSSSLGLGKMLRISYSKKYHVTKFLHRNPRNWTDTLVQAGSE